MSIAGNREHCGRCLTLVDVSTPAGWENLGGLGLDDLDAIVCARCITPVERARVDAIVSAGCADWADLEAVRHD